MKKEDENILCLAAADGSLGDMAIYCMSLLDLLECLRWVADGEMSNIVAFPWM